jgi:5'-nucleotidase
MAVSLETPVGYHLSYSERIDFNVAAYFTAFFAQRLLSRKMKDDVHVLKVEVPGDATRETPWKVARLSLTRYFFPIAPKRKRLDEPAQFSYRVVSKPEDLQPGTDSHVLRVEKVVAVTPLSLDLTSRVDLSDLERELRHIPGGE